MACAVCDRARGRVPPDAGDRRGATVPGTASLRAHVRALLATDRAGELSAKRQEAADASATSCAGGRPVPQPAGPASVEQAELERQLSSSRSAPPLPPAA